ncbi:hypothetical protein HYQ46_011168 [Verticillium longisporum]|nr:hypothetical protein HYQ46_011168 [Verticillium longisporum]
MKPTTAPLRKKVVHSVDTSFSSVEWPSISEQDQDAIMELIISLLAPLGFRLWEYATEPLCPSLSSTSSKAVFLLSPSRG